jgi:hypothetical protein
MMASPTGGSRKGACFLQWWPSHREGRDGPEKNLVIFLHALFLRHNETNSTFTSRTYLPSGVSRWCIVYTNSLGLPQGKPF